MERRRIRLGDVIDDYCTRCGLIMNHGVVSMVADEVRKVRCNTCMTEHVYKHARLPKRKRDQTAKLFDEVLKGLGRKTDAEVAAGAGVQAASGEQAAASTPAAASRTSGAATRDAAGNDAGDDDVVLVDEAGDRTVEILRVVQQGIDQVALGDDAHQSLTIEHRQLRDAVLLHDLHDGLHAVAGARRDQLLLLVADQVADAPE